MKTAIAMFTVGVLVAGVSGCSWFGGTTDSPQGGVVSKNEEFHITVPTSSTVKQGTSMTVTLSLNRGAYFKRDVDLEITAKGISVTPDEVTVKSSDKPDVQLQIAAARDAAIGDYRVSVKGTPESGEPTSTEFTVKVVAQ